LRGIYSYSYSYSHSHSYSHRDTDANTGPHTHSYTACHWSGGDADSRAGINFHFFQRDIHLECGQRQRLSTLCWQHTGGLRYLQFRNPHCPLGNGEQSTNRWEDYLRTTSIAYLTDLAIQGLHLQSFWRCSDTNTYCYSDSHRHPYSNTITDSHCHSDDNTNPYSYSHCHPNTYCYSNPHRYPYSNTNTYSHGYPDPHSNADSFTARHWSRGDADSGAGVNLHFFQRDVHLECGQRQRLPTLCW
jgi:hypothetical protein